MMLKYLWTDIIPFIDDIFGVLAFLACAAVVGCGFLISDCEDPVAEKMYSRNLNISTALALVLVLITSLIPSDDHIYAMMQNGEPDRSSFVWSRIEASDENRAIVDKFEKSGVTAFFE